MRGKYTAIEKDTLLKAYEENNRSMRATAKALGTSEKTIMRRMRDYGIEWDAKPFYPCNENFFDDLNEKSLYWLGFLATDGNIAKHGYSYQIRLKLAEKDLDHLSRFKDDLESQSPISFKTEKKNNKNFKKTEYKACEIVVTSRHLFDRLSEFNIVPNKTHIYRFPDKLKDHPGVRHFIRGCLDGDGWWREHRNNGKDYTTEVRVGMCGTPIFVKEMFDFIKDECCIESGSYYIRKSGKTADFEFCAKSAVNDIVDYLYHDATIYLPRKYEIAMKAKDYI